jgi:prepilin-type N-terminal cleavage/methylation domain-containing protein
MNRRGLTIVELLITLVVFGILGTALTRLMIANSRFVGRQEALLEARQTARAAMHLMSTELRMVSDGGLQAASAESVTAYVPYVFGALCRNEVAALMPTDSVIASSAVPAGIAGILIGGTYGFDTTIVITPGGAVANCTQDSIRVLPGGQMVSLSYTVGVPGTVFYLFQIVTYKFAPSAQLPGRVGLWRRVGYGAYEEILAPFATTARFAFLMGTRLTVMTNNPAPGNVQGLELRLVAESLSPPQGQATPTQYTLMPRIKFVNRSIQ